MLFHAEARKKELEANGYENVRIYGEKELDGLGVMYVLTEKAELFNLPDVPKKPTGKIFLRWLMGLIPGLAILIAFGKYLCKKSDTPATTEGGE
jgi:hypothetical protein